MSGPQCRVKDVNGKFTPFALRLKAPGIRGSSLYGRLARLTRVDRRPAVEWVPGSARGQRVWLPVEEVEDEEGFGGSELEGLRRDLVFGPVAHLSVYYDKWLREERALDNYLQ
jgi:hypothetical protein